MSLKLFPKKNYLKFLSLIIVISLIQISLQQVDQSLVDQIKKYEKAAMEKIKKYKEAFKNITANWTESEIEQATFFNETGISNLNQSTTNQKTIGLKYPVVSKYLSAMSRRFDFSEEVKKYFEPIFLNATSQKNDWKFYELMYNSNTTDTVYYVNFLVKNRFEEKKIDVIVTKIEMKFKISNFILIQQTSTDFTGKETKEIEYIAEEVEKDQVDNKIQVIQDVITYTAYKSLEDFLGIKEEKKFLEYLS